MTENELAISDVIADDLKNFCNIYTDTTDEDEGHSFTLSDSLYYTGTEFIDLINSRNFCNRQNLTIVTLNIANLLTKLRSLKLFLHNITTPENTPDIIVVVETHLTTLTKAGYTEQELRSIIPGYEFFHKERKNKKGGGVGIFVTERFSNKVKILDQIGITEEHFENLILQIPNCISTGNNIYKKDLTLAAVYRPPNACNYDAFNSDLEKLLQVFDRNKDEVVLTGDFNLDLLKYENHLPTANYIDLVINHKLLPRIVRPTRIKKQSATLIDHIFTKDESNHLVSGIIDVEIAGNSGYTDHLPVFTILRTQADKNRKKEIIFKSFFTKQGSEERREKLRQEDWNSVYEQDDPNIIYDMIQQKYGQHYHDTITMTTHKKGSNRYKREPWMTMDILADIRRRDRLAKQKHRREDYKKLRNEIVSRTRRAEREHIRQQIENSYGNIKKHWNVIKKATNKMNNKEDTPNEFHYQGNSVIG